jgi:hypothetical protein
MTTQILAIVALVAAVGGCVRLPASTICGYRSLAHPTMTPDAISFGLDGHVRAVTEGATGGPGN